MGILIVDDTLFMRVNMNKMLKENNYEVLGEASDGLEAIEKYKELKPELVIMDITMPRMDGISAIKEIKKIDKNSNIIVCSAMGQQSLVMEAIKLGAKSYVVKPYKKERLLEEIDKVIGN